MCKKLGLRTVLPDDLQLVRELLEWMQRESKDYTKTFADLRASVAEFSEWNIRWQQRLEQEGNSLVSAEELMRMVNPKIIPRNHLVEEVLQAAVERDDYQPITEFFEALQNPFAESLVGTKWDQVPAADAKRYRTFCGT